MSHYRIIIVSSSVTVLQSQIDRQCFHVPFPLLDTVLDVVATLCFTSGRIYM
jgi:hypothetical protein